MGPEIVSSGQHAMRAFRESVRSASHHAYSVNDLGDLIGPMTPDELIVMDADGNKIEGECRASVGANLPEALFSAIYLEDSAKTYLAAKAAARNGHVDILIDEQADAAVEVFKDYGQKSK